MFNLVSFDTGGDGYTHHWWFVISLMSRIDPGPEIANAKTFAAVRPWLTFSLVAFMAAIIGIAMDGDHPLRSDDPYIIGFAVGAVCSFFSLCWVVAPSLRLPPSKQPLAYFVPFAALVLLLIIGDVMSPGSEGAGMGILFGTLIAVFGILAFPVQRLTLNYLRVAVISVPGIIFLVGYVYVAFIYFPSLRNH